ncbi:MAG: hypothetical protein NC489_25975 [Ruminococcus flavefaciens]|nr:hypothetical protein [Ruminococcus flavefaciens]
MAEINSFRKTTLSTIMAHIEPNIRHQPLKMSAVFLLPPIAKASGERITSSAVTTYRSAISKKSFTICHMITMPTMMTKSQEAPILKQLSSGRVTVTLEGIWSRSMIWPDMPRPISQICWLANRRKPKIKVLVNNNFGSSPSKPSPVAILFMA